MAPEVVLGKKQNRKGQLGRLRLIGNEFQYGTSRLAFLLAGDIPAEVLAGVVAVDQLTGGRDGLETESTIVDPRPRNAAFPISEPVDMIGVDANPRMQDNAAPGSLRLRHALE